MYQKISTLVMAALAGTVLFSGAALADRDRDDRKHQRYERYERHPDKSVKYYKIKMEPGAYRDINRRMTRAYYDRSPSYYRHVNYVVGRPLPHHTVVWDVPRDVRHTLPRPYANTQYVWVDRDILLIDRRDNTVLDIIRAVLN